MSSPIKRCISLTAFLFTQHRMLGQFIKITRNNLWHGQPFAQRHFLLASFINFPLKKNKKVQLCALQTL